MKKIISLVLVLGMTVVSMSGFATPVVTSAPLVKPVLISAPLVKPTVKIIKVEENKVHLLMGDMVRIFDIENSKDFFEGQIVKIIENIDNKVVLEHFLDISNIKFNSMGSLIEKNILVNEQNVEFDIKPQVINGIVMIPLRMTLESLGYEISWNGETETIDIHKGAQWTSIRIGENSYFKNKMAPVSLSSAPILKDSRTLIPVEFLYEVLGLGLSIDNGDLTVGTKMMATHSGYIQKVRHNRDNTASIVISSKEISESMGDQKIINVDSKYTYFNTELNEGAFITAISPPMMTMSIPGQTSGIVIFSQK